jgi:hypothetical protein
LATTPRERRKGVGPNWIARRRLRWRKGTVVTIAIGAPRRLNAEEWRCPYRVTGLGRRPVDYAQGIDSLQSLTNAIVGIRRVLEPFRADLSWEGGAQKGDFGVWMSVPGAFGRDFALRLEGLIEREMDRLGKAAVRRRANARVKRKEAGAEA